jgi:hypothetical protein
MCVQPQRRSTSIYSNKSQSCGGVFDSTLVKGVFVYYAGYSFPYQGRKVLIYYSLSGAQPVAGGTCIPLMQYYLQNVVKILVYSTEVDAKLHLVWKVVNQHVKFWNLLMD